MAGVNALYGILVEAGADENVVDIVSCKINWKTGALHWEQLHIKKIEYELENVM